MVTASLTRRLAEDVATLRGGLRAVTGPTGVIGGRYGQMAATFRNAGGSL